MVDALCSAELFSPRRTIPRQAYSTRRTTCSSYRQIPHIQPIRIIQANGILHSQAGQWEIDKRRSTLLGQRLGQHGLPAPRVSIQQHPLGCAEEPVAASEQLWESQGVYDRLPETRDNLVQAPDTLKRDIDGRRRDNLPSDSLLVLVQLELVELRLGQAGLSEEGLALLPSFLRLGGGRVGYRGEDIS